MQKYFWKSLKSRIPLFVILTSVMIIFAIITIGGTNFLYQFSRGYGYTNPIRSITFPSMIYYIPLFVFVSILPFFGMNYRYSLRKSDLFRQVAFKNKRIRYIEHGTLLITAVLMFIISFLVFAFGLMMKYSGTTFEKHVSDDVIQIIHEFHFGYLWLTFLPLLAHIFITYAVSYFFISRGNTITTSILCFIFGHTIFFALFMFIVMCAPVFYYGPSCFSILMMYPSLTTSALFDNLIVNGDAGHYFWYDARFFEALYGYIDSDNIRYVMIPHNTESILSTVLYGIMGIVGGLTFFLDKDPSGEYAGKPENPNFVPDVIFHLGIASVGLVSGGMVCISTLNIYYLLFLGVFLPVYYILYGLYKKDFRLRLNDILILLGVTAVVVIATLVTGFTHAIGY